MQFNLRLIRYILQFLLFSFYWSLVSGSYSYGLGIAVFTFFCSTGLILANRFKKPLAGASAASLILICFFVVSRLLQGLLFRFPLPWDFGGVLFQSLFSLLILPILVFVWLEALSRRFSWFCFIEAAVYTGVLAFLLGNPSWSLELVFGKVPYSFLGLSVCITGILLLLLSGGKQSVSIRLRTEGVVFFLLLILIMIPISRLYQSGALKEGGGLIESTPFGFHFDLTDYLTLESKISMKDELVFLMRQEGRPADDLYLRRFVLGGYTAERGFFRDPEHTKESPGVLSPEYSIPEKPVRWNIPEFDGREWVEQTLFLLNINSFAFLGLNLPAEIIPYHAWEDSSFSRVYKVRSLVSQVPEWEFLFLSSPEGEPTPEKQEFLEYYTEFADQEDLHVLAAEITEGAIGNYQKAAAIEEYLKSEYFYSLSPGTAKDGDQLRHFLYDSQKGYCSYFAFSMTLLCRSLGIPARVAVGFWIDGKSQILNFYPVKANQAHAWVEVFFPEKGWIEFDPTSQTLAPGEDFDFSRYNPEELEPYIREILDNQDMLRVSEIEFEDSSAASEGNILRIGWEHLKSRPGLALLWIGISFLCLQSLRILILFIPLPRRRKRIIPYYRAHRTMIIRALAPDGGGMSPSELADRAAGFGAVLFRQFTEEYLALRFDPHSGECRAWFGKAWAVRKELRRIIGIKKILFLFFKTLWAPGRLL
jgi:transglutaminase-like putative cysteine protease